jgi:hypothetical protein
MDSRCAIAKRYPIATIEDDREQSTWLASGAVASISFWQPQVCEVRQVLPISDVATGSPVAVRREDPEPFQYLLP